MPSQLSSRKTQEILGLRLRSEIYSLVKRFSGCNFHHLERKSRIPAGTLQYHLAYLTKHGLLTIQRDGNKMRYFTQDLTIKDRELLTLLRQRTIRCILLFMLNNKECRQKDIIAFVKMSPSTVSWYLSRLLKTKIISVAKRDRYARYHLAVKKEEILSLLISYKESFFDALVDHTIDMWTFQL